MEYSGLRLFLDYALLFLSLYVIVFFVMLYIKYKNKIFESPKQTSWKPFVSVIIPAYNEQENIEKCVRAVLECDYPKDKLEIIVVDDGSKDNTLEIVKSIKYPKLIVLTKPNSGKAASINFGIKYAKGEIIATMDADSFIQKDVIDKMLPLFDSEDVAAITAAVLVRPSNKWLQELQRIEYLSMIFTRRLLSFVDAVPVTPGPFSMFRAWVFERLGGFDEQNIVEDHEMAFRIQSSNYKIKSSIDAVVYTETPDTVSALLKQRVRWYRGGLHNTFNYRHLMSPKYGDFGIMVVPLILLSLLSFFLVFTLIYDSVLNPPIYAYHLGVSGLFLSIGPTSMAAFCVLLLWFLWAYIAAKSFKDQSSDPLSIFLFLLFYGYLTIAYNIVTIAKEIRKERFSW